MPPVALSLPPRSTQYWAEPPLPLSIVLDGREIVKPFYDKVKNLPVAPTVLFDNTDMLNSVLQAIAYDQSAEITLELDVLDMVSQMVGGMWAADVELVAYGMVEFGQRLLQTLRYMNAYRNGYLSYQHGNWLGTDIMLHRLIVPELNLNQPGFSERSRHWAFGPGTSPANNPEDHPLPATIQRDLSGIYTDLAAPSEL
jgi:hypothetical protein